METVAFDTETCLIRPACCAPPLVCVTWQIPGSNAQIIHHTDAEPLLRQWLQSYLIVGQNVAYDLAVVAERFPDLRPLVFKAYAEDRVTDTMIRQQLLDIAGGIYRGRIGEKGRWIEHKYGLEDLAKRLANMQLVKDGWRLSYGEFLDVPLSQWPQRAREVQDAARPRVAELDREIAFATERKDEEHAKALTKVRDGLQSMIDSDPDRASEYPLDDARATLAVYEKQEVHAGKWLADQYRQARAAFALHLSSAWGLRTDAVGVELLRAATQAAYDALEKDLIEIGLIRNDKKKSRDTKLAKARMIKVCAEEGLPLRRTDGHGEEELTWSERLANGEAENAQLIAAGKKPKKIKPRCVALDGTPLDDGDERCAEHVCLDAEACAATDDDVIHDYAEISTLKKVLSNDVEALLKGIEYPVHTRYGLAETGRTTSSKPNIQNVRKLPGIRECFIPRPGKVLFAADFPALESYTWAQCCVRWLGQSKLAEALNTGLDPHLILAAEILGLAYDEAKRRHDAGDQEVDDIRQLAKVGNFGFPGGMGAPKMLTSAKKQLKPEVVARLRLELDPVTGEKTAAGRMVQLKEHWFAAWPEAQLYFARIKSLGPPYPQRYYATVETLFTKRIRGGATYCAACNNGFQALGCDCAKEAAWRICREQYDCPGSPLFNTRTVGFIHDEFLGEGDEATAPEAAERLADVMVEGANIYLPDVPIKRAKLKPVLMRRWSKKAKPVLGADGRLIPWAA